MARNQQANVPSAVQGNTVSYPQNAAPSFTTVNPSSSTVMPLPGQAVNMPGVGGVGYPNMSMPPPNYGQGMPNGHVNLPIIQQQLLQPQQAPPAVDLAQLGYIRAFQANNVPQESWASLLELLSKVGAPFNGGNATPTPGYGGFAGSQDVSAHDRNGLDQNMPEYRARNGRNRSRSPNAWDRHRGASPPRRRDSPVYGEYGSDRGRGDGRRNNARGGGQNAYRQRSPDARSRRSPSPPRAFGPPQPKWIEYDRTMPQGEIKGMKSAMLHTV